MLGADVVVVDDIVVGGDVVVVVDVGDVDVVVVVAAGSFDDVHDATTSAVATSKYGSDLMVIDSIRLNRRRRAQPRCHSEHPPSRPCRSQA